MTDNPGQIVREEEKKEVSKEYSILFPGDAKRDALKNLLSKYKNTDVLRSNVLVVGNQGSSESLSKEFLEAVQPDKAIISRGWNYVKGYEETLYNLNSQINKTEVPDNGRFKNIYSTWTDGKITVKVFDNTTNKIVATMTVFNVEDGKCILVESGGEKMLIDAGSGTRNYIDGESVRSEYFKELDNIENLKYMVISHPHLNHYNYINTRLRNNNPFNVTDNVFVANVNLDDCSESYRSFYNDLTRIYGTKVKRAVVGDTFFLGADNELKFSVIGPIEQYDNDLDNLSVVLKMSYQPVIIGEKRELITEISYQVLSVDGWENRSDIESWTYLEDDSQQIREYAIREAEDEVLLMNYSNYREWIINTTKLYSEIGKKEDDEEDEKTIEKIRKMIYKTLMTQDYNVITQYDVWNAYEKYLKASPYEDDPFQKIEGSWSRMEGTLGEEDTNSVLRLKKDSNITTIGELKEVSGNMIEDAINIIDGYLKYSNDFPAYYPSDVILRYLKNLNEQIYSITGVDIDEKREMRPLDEIEIRGFIGIRELISLQVQVTRFTLNIRILK